MSSAKKLLEAAAGSAAGGGGLDITDVFSTFLYTGDGGNGTAIVNGIDLSGEGGLVWRKKRAGSGTVPDHTWVDTERGRTKFVFSNLNDEEVTSSNSITSFNNNGFTIVDNNSYGQNLSSETYASWTFRKAEKFFDIVTYTGNGSANRAISHNLGSSPGMVLIKQRSAGEGFVIWHRSLPSNKMLTFSANATSSSTPTFDSSLMSSTTFGINAGSASNSNGGTYVAYLFAHNDGGFGPDADQDIISCGSYTGNGSTNGPVVTLGWEPQWLMYKNTNGTDSWQMVDTMRGMPVDSNTMRILKPNTTALETSGNSVAPTATGFQVKNPGGGNNDNGSTYIYMAIRAPMITPPAAATDVFVVSPFNAGGESKAPGARSGFPVDIAFYKSTAGSGSQVSSRLTQPGVINASSNAAEAPVSASTFDYNNGYYNLASAVANYYAWMWKRAKGYADVVTYNGNGTAGRTVTHSLGVAPEMMWVKNREDTAYQSGWAVYHGDNTNYLLLNENQQSYDDVSYWNDTSPTSEVFSLGVQSMTNKNNTIFIAYLFATLAGISKVGSVSHSGSSTDVNCGFSNGARFVMLKRTDATGDWYYWDSVRGIVAGNDPYLLLNTSAAQVTNTDYIDPLSSGFTITGDFTDGDYIFYAIA